MPIYLPNTRGGAWPEFWRKDVRLAVQFDHNSVNRARYPLVGQPLNNAKYSRDRYGYVADFGDTSNIAQIDFGAHDFLNDLAPMTVIFRTKCVLLPGGSNDERAIARLNVSAGGYGWGIGPIDDAVEALDNFWMFTDDFGSATAGSFSVCTPENTVVIDKWTTIAATIRVPVGVTATSADVDMWQDGVRVGIDRATSPSARVSDAPYNLFLGDQANVGDEPYAGKIAGVYILQGELSDAEHARLHADFFAPLRESNVIWLPTDAGGPTITSVGGDDALEVGEVGALIAGSGFGT